MKEQWKIGEVAELAGLTIRTLRYYDQIGLFSPSHYTDSGHRIYTKADLTRLQPILSLKQIGVSLDEIHLLLVNSEEPTAKDILQTQIVRIKKDIAIQQNLLKELENAVFIARNKQEMTVIELTKLMEALKMNQEKYFTKQQLDKLKSRYENTDQQALKATEQEFKELIIKIGTEKEKGTLPSDVKVQEYARKWNDIVDAFSEGDLALWKNAEQFHAENPGNELQHNVDTELYKYINEALRR